MNDEAIIKDFINSPLRCYWMSLRFIDVFVRKGHHLIDGKVARCFDIANVNAREKGEGHFTRLLEHLENVKIEFDYLYVESILNERLEEFFNRRSGWVRIPGENVNFYFRK